MDNHDELKLPGTPSLDKGLAKIAALTRESVYYGQCPDDPEQTHKVSQDYMHKVRDLVRYFDNAGVSGRLPGTIRTIALYGLSFLPAVVSDEDLERITLAAAQAVLGPDFEFYLEYYVQQKAEAAKPVTGLAKDVSKKIKLVKGPV